MTYQWVSDQSDLKINLVSGQKGSRQESGLWMRNLELYLGGFNIFFPNIPFVSVAVSLCSSHAAEKSYLRLKPSIFCDDGRSGSWYKPGSGHGDNLVYQHYLVGSSHSEWEGNGSYLLELIFNLSAMEEFINPHTSCFYALFQCFPQLKKSTFQIGYSLVLLFSQTS